jgi:hypothetical protein
MMLVRCWGAGVSGGWGAGVGVPSGPWAAAGWAGGVWGGGVPSGP